MINEFGINDQGTLVLFTPLTDTARAWWSSNVDPDAQTYGAAYVVEHRYAQDIIEGIKNEKS